MFSPDLITTLYPLAAPVWHNLNNNLKSQETRPKNMNLKLEFSHIFTFFFTTMQSRCCHVDGLDNLMSYTVQYVLITSSWVKWSHSLESWNVSVRRCCGSQASGWSGSCWPEPVLWWTLSLSVWWTEPLSPAPLEWWRWTSLCHQSLLQVTYSMLYHTGYSSNIWRFLMSQW